jgi:hypothetical protein
MFDFLTGIDWCAADCGQKVLGTPVPCRKLRFLRAGTFLRWTHSDVLEADGEGDWNFVLESDSSGLVMAGGHSVFVFERRGDLLWFAGRMYRPCVRPVTVSDSTGRKRSDLRTVPTPGLLSALCRTPWASADDFDLFRIPQTIRFEPDLRCQFGFRDGQCRQSGRYSIEGGSVILEMESPGCDQRGGANNYEDLTVDAGVAGDTLSMSGRLYVPSGSDRTRRRAVNLGNHGALHLDLAFDGGFRVGVPTRLTITFHVTGYSPRDSVHLSELRVGMQQSRIVGYGLTGTGPKVALVRRVYDRDIAAGAVSDTLTIVPPLQGENVILEFAWDCRDRRQDYHPSARPVVRVR